MSSMFPKNRLLDQKTKDKRLSPLQIDGHLKNIATEKTEREASFLWIQIYKIVRKGVASTTLQLQQQEALATR